MHEDPVRIHDHAWCHLVLNADLPLREDLTVTDHISDHGAEVERLRINGQSPGVRLGKEQELLHESP